MKHSEKNNRVLVQVMTGYLCSYVGLLFKRRNHFSFLA
jgi:hypothetical protein